MKRAGWLLAAALVGLLPLTATSSDAACCRGGKPMMMKGKAAKAPAMKGRLVAYRGGWRRGAWRRGGALRFSAGPVVASPPPYFYSQYSRVAGVYVARPVEIGPGAPAPRRFFFGLF